MAIRKSDLRDFIVDKSSKRKSELRTVVDQAIVASIKPTIFSTYEGAAVVEVQAEKLHGSILKLQQQYKKFDTWKFSNIVRELDGCIISIRQDIVRQQASSILSNLLDRHTNGIMKELAGVVTDLASANAKTIQEYQDLVKLTNELTTIIDASHNGDKAYKRLEELGVDLSGFDSGSKNLPAVIKLSVNPCLINGNCS